MVLVQPRNLWSGRNIQEHHPHALLGQESKTKFIQAEPLAVPFDPQDELDGDDGGDGGLPLLAHRGPAAGDGGHTGIPHLLVSLLHL